MSPSVSQCLISKDSINLFVLSFTFLASITFTLCPSFILHFYFCFSIFLSLFLSSFLTPSNFHSDSLACLLLLFLFLYVSIALFLSLSHYFSFSLSLSLSLSLPFSHSLYLFLSLTLFLSLSFSPSEPLLGFEHYEAFIACMQMPAAHRLKTMSLLLQETPWYSR